MTTPKLICLVCELNLEDTSCTNVFYTSMPRNGELLASFVQRVLQSTESGLRSSYVCSRCHHLFQMLEQAQWTVANIRCEILKVYNSDSEKKLQSNSSCEEIVTQDKIFLESLVEDKLDINATLHSEPNVSDLSTFTQEPQQTSEQHVAIVDDQLIKESEETFARVINESSLQKHLQDTLILTHEIQNSNSDKLKRLNTDNNKKSIEKEFLNNNHTNSFDSKEDDFHTFKESSNLLIDKKSILSRHEKMALYNKQCRTCSRLFKSATDLKIHIIKHGGSRPYYCEKCRERFESISLANIHAMDIHVNEKDIIVIATEPCQGETIDFTQDDCIFPEEVLRMSEMEEQDDFEWKESSESLTEVKENAESLKRNDSTLDQESAKQRSEYRKASRKSGRISKYSLKPLNHLCPTCGKKWRTSAELKTHMKSHSSLRPYMCEKCGQAYKHRHALEIHVGMHNGINPFQCSFCNKCFTQKGALMRHLPIHTGETPYQCELCGKRFVHHTSYNMHALSHTGQKSYRCHVCDLSLLSTSHLKRHMRVHTGEKPYSCSLCGKRFAERYNLFAHQKIHDPAEITAKEAKKMQYKCELCSAQFDKRQKLQDHAKLHTKSDSDVERIDTHKILELTRFYTGQNQESMKEGGDWSQDCYSKAERIPVLAKKT
ncbi:zinc finger protein 2 isoform X2 [Cephus cinctus]|uniref:Zinc finger protein 2 isoform X2 n=1 Tax=Cephus cinctus TaxID=211228 RepID=A0AAJ7CFU3_CEPCN|nr:zinc finger protein 2 isoform X2 [Cephus cinctus]